MFLVYDNHGITIDRYSIYLFETQDGVMQQEHATCITTNGDPSEFWQHMDFAPVCRGKSETIIDITELPLKAQQQLLKELQAEE